RGCRYTVAGSQTASGTCTGTASVAPASSGVSLTVVDGSTLAFAATLTNQTTLTDGDYSEADAAPGFGATYVVGTSGSYLLCSSSGNCTTAMGAPTSAQGTFDLTITDPGPSQGSGAATLWNAPQGTLEITLPAQPGGALSGAVMVNVTL